MKEKHLVTTDNSPAFHPTRTLHVYYHYICYVCISSSPPLGLVLLDMYGKNTNPSRINSLPAIHFSFCQTMREGGKTLWLRVRIRISGDYHTHPIAPDTQISRGQQYYWSSQITRPVLQVAFPVIWMNVSSIYSRHTLWRARVGI